MLPLIGSIHHLATAGELPHHALTRLAGEHGPVMHLQTGQTDLVVVSSREAAMELTGPKTLLYGCADVAFASGPHWRRLRKLCVVELLSASRVRSFAHVRREETRALLCNIAAAGKPPGTAAIVGIRAVLEELSSAIVSRTVLGKTFEHRGALLKEGVELTSVFCLSDHFPSLSFLDVPMRLRLRRVHRQVDRLLEDIIAERKKLRQEMLLFTAENMLDVLLDAMEQQTTDSRELPQLVVKETLRLHMPAPLLVPRVCRSSAASVATRFRPASRWFINAWRMGRDPGYWEDAETFRPARFIDRDDLDYKGTNSFEFLPFALLAQLLFHFDWKLPGGMAPEDR
ncbi:hypothetical protein HU200_014481 [Digitaria exilis]|uniref:Cytochrome P450 n=1 Tax=Digitaria exilis TaxID=1010633 RepID=A0A835FCD4_9POAL|nr:hypothetical protein HU200_014481 [Digitaria exilis]